MHTSVVFALLGLTAIGPITTQANDTFLAGLDAPQYDNAHLYEVDNFEAELEQLLGEEQDEEDIVQLNKSQLVQMRELMGQMTKLIELQGMTARRLAEDCVKHDAAAVKATPNFSIPDFRHAAEETAQSRRDFQYKIMDLGAASHAIVGEIKNVARLLPKMKSTKVQQLVFKQLVHIIQNAESATSGLKNSAQFAKVLSMKDDISHLKNMTPAKLQASLSGINNDIKKITSNLNQLSAKMIDSNQGKSQMISGCNTDPADCANLVNTYINNRTKALNASKAGVDKQYDALQVANEDKKGVATGLKNFKVELKNFPQLLEVADQFKDFIGPYGEFTDATQQVVKDIQAFFKKQPISQNLDIGSAEYIKIRDYGLANGAMDSTHMMKAMRTTLGQAIIQNGCTNQEVQNMVNRLAGDPPVKVYSACSTTPFK